MQNNGIPARHCNPDANNLGFRAPVYGPTPPVYGPTPPTYTAIPADQLTPVPCLIYSHKDRSRGSKRSRKSKKGEKKTFVNRIDKEKYMVDNRVHPNKEKVALDPPLLSRTIEVSATTSTVSGGETKLTALETLESYIPITWVCDESKEIRNGHGAYLVYNCTIDGITFEGEGSREDYAKENAAFKALKELEFPDVDLKNIKQTINHEQEEGIFGLVVREYYRTRQYSLAKRQRLELDRDEGPPAKRDATSTETNEGRVEEITQLCSDTSSTLPSSSSTLPSSSSALPSSSSNNSTTSPVFDALHSTTPEVTTPEAAAMAVPSMTYIVEMFTRKYGALEPDSGFSPGVLQNHEGDSVFTLKSQGSVFVGIGSTRKSAKRDAARRAWMKFERNPPPEVLRSDREMAIYESKLMGEEEKSRKLNQLERVKNRLDKVEVEAHNLLNSGSLPSRQGTAGSQAALTAGSQATLTEKLVRYCLKYVSKQLSKRGYLGKVNTRQLCCIVKVVKTGYSLKMNPYHHEVIAYAGGESVIASEKASDNGTLINDSTGTTLAVRAFRRWLINELIRFLKLIHLKKNKKPHTIFRRDAENNIEVKPGVEFHMVCYSVPNGDATLSSSQLAGSTKANCPRETPGMIQVWSLPKVWDDQEKPESRLINATLSNEKKHGGIVSPSAKLAIRSVTGIQGALLSLLIKSPIYISHYHIRNKFEKEALHRALYSRAKIEGVDAPEPTFTFLEQNLENFATEFDNLGTAEPKLSFVCCLGVPFELIDPSTGKMGELHAEKSKFSTKFREVKEPSSICSKNLYSLIKPYIPLNREVKGYRELKKSAAEYQKLKQQVKDKLWHDAKGTWPESTVRAIVSYYDAI